MTPPVVEIDRDLSLRRWEIFVSFDWAPVPGLPAGEIWQQPQYTATRWEVPAP